MSHIVVEAGFTIPALVQYKIVIFSRFHRWLWAVETSNNIYLVVAAYVKVRRVRVAKPLLIPLLVRLFA